MEARNMVKRVRCIEGKGELLEKGKVYQVVHENEDYYYLTGNTSYAGWNKSRFEVVEIENISGTFPISDTKWKQLSVNYSKKEKTMKKFTWTKEQIEALEDSIENKWIPALNGCYFNDANDCDCCKSFFSAYGCENCPIKIYTGVNGCKDTPYVGIINHMRCEHRLFRDYESQCSVCDMLIQKEIDFLKEVLEAGIEKKVLLHGKEIKVGDKVWSYVEGWGVVEDIYPNFKKSIVVDFKNNLIDFTLNGKEWESDINPTLFWEERTLMYIGVDWSHSFVDPLIVLIPKEELKKKVFKYKVLYKAVTGYFGVSISHYKDLIEFNCEYPEWKGIQLIEESKREFEES